MDRYLTASGTLVAIVLAVQVGRVVVGREQEASHVGPGVLVSVRRSSIVFGDRCEHVRTILVAPESARPDETDETNQA